jgi:amino acid adenylation domain-containing protein
VTTHLLDRFIAQPGARLACIVDGERLTYADLRARVNAQACALASRGVGADDIVAFDALRRADTLALLLAILHLGAAYLPLDPALPAERRRQILDDAQPRLVAEPRDSPASSACPASLCSGDLAYVLFTSGSTGRPKGVAMRAAAVAALIDWHVAHPRLGKPARTLHFAPLSFDVSFQEILSTFATGGTLVVANDSERRDPWALLDLIEREQIERAFLPYVALQAIADAAMGAGRAPPTSLIDVVTAGEQLRITPAIRALFASLPNAVLHNHYGPTEAHVVTAHELAGDSARWPDLPPIGQALPHVRVRLGDDDAADEGELLLGGDCLARGYINRPDLTAERFIERDGQRWYRTGDNVRRDANGTLDYIGRLDDQIKLAGYRIEPAEIEAVIGRHPHVAQVAVVAVGTGSEKRLAAHIVPRDGTTTHAELIGELQRMCAAALPAYMVPQEFAVHALLPLTASGKIDRRRLAHEEAQAGIAWNDGAPLAEQIASLWKQLLGVAQLGVNTNLFDHGARSLMVVQALTELRRRGHVLSVAQVYEHPTIAAQVALLSEPKTTTTAPDDGRGERQRAALSRFARGDTTWMRAR